MALFNHGECVIGYIRRKGDILIGKRRIYEVVVVGR